MGSSTRTTLPIPESPQILFGTTYMFSRRARFLHRLVMSSATTQQQIRRPPEEIWARCMGHLARLFTGSLIQPETYGSPLLMTMAPYTAFIMIQDRSIDMTMYYPRLLDRIRT